MQNLPLGICKVCKMRGWLQMKVYISPDDVSGVRDEKGVPELAVCLTCAETPTGMVSENLRHERYPQAEYDKDKVPAKK